MFGAIFKEKRESLGISLEDVSSELKIRKRYLDAIERDDHEEFNSGFYLKGYVKNYARYLEIDESKFIEFLEESPEIDLSVYTPKVESQVPSKKLLYLSLLMLVIVIFIAKLIFKSNFSKVAVENPPDTIVDEQGENQDENSVK